MLRRCMGCMEEYDDEYEVCPHCGYIHGSDAEEAYHMQPESILGGRYIVGKVLGFGGFGVTYIGWDAELERKVAIKEYLPSEFATRMPEQTQVTVFSGDRAEQFSSGMEKFMGEAKRLAKFHATNGIVHIYDSFSENNTAYIVMEYLKGESLKSYLERVGKIPVEEAVDIILPILYGLKEVHAQEIIHRDIAPDNIFLTDDLMEDGKRGVKLLDFGSARFATTKHSKSLSVLIKPGFSPEEQYRSRGDQGPWTDVYSCAATLYKMITGITPQDSMERTVKDLVKAPSKMGIKLSKGMENAILNAMNIKIENRTASVEEFIAELENESTARKKEHIKKVDVGKWPLWLKITAGAASAMVATFIVLLATGVIHFNIGKTRKSVVPDGFVRVPNVVNKLLTDAEESIYGAKIQYSIVGKEYSDVIEKDRILSQNINGGNIIEENYVINLTISGGVECFEVPNVVGYSEEKASSLLEEMTFVTVVEEQYDAMISAGYVISQSEEPGSMLAHDSEVVIVVSMGRDPEEEFMAAKVIMPNLVGMKLADAMQEAAKYGILLNFETVYSNTVDADIVMEQSVEPDTEIMNDEEVSLVVSLGKHYEKVPNVIHDQEKEAQKKLKNKSLKYEITYEESDIVAAGLVMSQSIDEGTVVLADTVIKLVVSSGRGSFEMPSVTDMTKEDAKTKLTGLGLTLDYVYEHSDSVKNGRVISQSVEAGTRVFAGNSVVLTISSGAELFKVPDVKGKTEEDAIAELKAQTLVVKVNDNYDDNVAAGLVVDQTLEPGTSQKRGASITITVSKGKLPVQITLQAGTNATVDGKSSVQRTVYATDTYGTLPDPTRTGYTFAGWFTEASGGSKVSPDTKVENRTGHALYAHWDPIKSKVTFDVNGAGISVPNPITVTYDGKYDNLPDITRTGYNFDGWFTAASGGTQITKGTQVAITSEQKLWAHWTAKTYTVTYDANGGSVTTKNASVTYDKTYVSLPTPTRTGYTFDGWYNAKSGGTKIGTTTKVTTANDHTLYAHWKANTYTVTYDANGGSVTPTSASVTYDKTYDNLPKPTRTGYTFDGWYTAKSGGTRIETTTKVTTDKNHTLYAHWTENTYTISFNANGGSGTVNSQSGIMYSATVTLNKNQFKRDGYTFKGWSTSNNGKSIYSDGQTVTGLTSTNNDTVTLYAVWEPNKYIVTVIFKSVNGTELGTVTVEGKQGDTPNITLPDYTGYNKPSSSRQIQISYDNLKVEISGYEPIKQGDYTEDSSNSVFYEFWDHSPKDSIYCSETHVFIKGGLKIYQQRVNATSVKIRVIITSTIEPNHALNYDDLFKVTCGTYDSGYQYMQRYNASDTFDSYDRSTWCWYNSSSTKRDTKQIDFGWTSIGGLTADSAYVELTITREDGLHNTYTRSVRVPIDKW